MSKSSLFSQAHALCKSIIQAGDDYRITFGACLKSIREGKKMDKVCVAIEHGHCESNGAFTTFTMWDGEEVFYEGGMYDRKGYNHYEVNATPEQFKAACEWLKTNAEETIPRDRATGLYTYIGCTVKLSRSRKAPNKVELRVTDYQRASYDQTWMREIPAQVRVTDGEQHWTVSASCVKDVVKGVKELPYWLK